MSLKRTMRLVRKQSLQRKTPLKCKNLGLHRPGRALLSASRGRLIRMFQVERRAFLVKFPRCAYPGCQRRAVSIHEIAFGRGIRHQAYGERCTWLPSCSMHNLSGAGFHDLQAMPLAHQCALKQLLDPQHFDLPRINVLRGRSPQAITEADVAEFLVSAELGTQRD